MPSLEPLALGVMTGIGEDPRASFAKIRELGFPSCQINGPSDRWLRGPEADALNDNLRRAIDDTGIVITSVFVGWAGHIWNLFGGPRTIGLVPPQFRGERVVSAIRVSEWAKRVGITALTSHIGFIPEDPADEGYEPFIRTMRALIDYVIDNGQTFAFETGQETARTLVRTINDIDRHPHVGINLDPANLLLYGKDRPMNVVDQLAPFVFNTHCKDGFPPEPGAGLGHEVPLGEGDVRIRELIPALYERGYRGPLTIEREISGPQQTADILKAKALLEAIRAGLTGPS
jgi:sugar phosphate isomerase/epimerase